MTTTIRTIDITPTQAEQARVIAYLFGGHTGKNALTAWGDYWNYTPEEEARLFTAWGKIDIINTALEGVGLTVWELSDSQRKKIINRALDS